MKIKQDLIIYLFGLLVFLAGCDTTPKSGFTYAEPETKGYSSQKLELLKEHLEKSGSSSMMIMVDGAIIFEWGETSKKHTIHSIRKALLNSLVGIAIEQGKIDTSLTLKQLGINDIEPKLSENEQQAKIIDLLKSRSGIYHDAAAVSEAMLRSKPKRNSFAPGEHYYYNNWDFNALGTIFEQETGTKIFEEFKRKIADPVGMEDFSIENCYYQNEPEKSMHPAYHFRMSARDMARFGVIYQKNGMWKDLRIIPSEWISESTTAYSIEDSTSGLGYGYMWNVFPEGSLIAEMVGYPGYFHTGIGVHALVIIPELKLVIVERFDTDGEWVDPDVGMELGMMIINARISD